MPSVEHQGPLQLLQNAPDLSPRLLRALGVAVPDYIEARIADIDFSQLVPTEYAADKVVTLWSGRKRPDLGIVNEVQLGIDPRKKFTWPLYNAALRANVECGTCLLVITLDEAVARWARQPITDLQPGCSLVPLVLGPEQVPCARTKRRSRSLNSPSCRRWPTATREAVSMSPRPQSKPPPSWTVSARRRMLIWSCVLCRRTTFKNWCRSWT